MGTLFVSGLSHREAPVAVREQLALEADKLREVLGHVMATGAFAEVMILSTCNRVEVYGVAGAPAAARALTFRQLGAQRGMALDGLEPMLYTKTETDAVHHAFRVAASLDSMIVGEPQILGQVNAVSVSFAAVELAKKIFAGLDGRTVLLVGAGEMGELAARHLVEQGAFPIYVANRTWARAQELARALAGTAVPFADLEATMAIVDIVVTSTGASEPIITREAVQRALYLRRSRPLFFVDIAVPRDVEPTVNELANVFCYDIDALKQVVDANLREREREAQRAEAIVKHEVERFVTRRRDQEVVPTIVSLRTRLEAIRQAELEKALAKLPDASAETRQTLEALSTAIVNKILHAPITKLRESSRAGEGGSWTAFVHELFGLRRDAP